MSEYKDACETIVYPVYKKCGAVTYSFQGPCEEAKNEIKKISREAIPECRCEKEICRTEINPHLRPNIQRLLLQSSAHDTGPNCHDTALQGLGFKVGFYEADRYEIKLIINSPYCKRRIGRPEAGDIIVANGHTFIALTDEYAFNKTGASKAHPYEIIRIDHYFTETRQDVSCQFLTNEEALQKKCETTSRAFSCELPEGLRNFDSISQDGLSLSRQVDELSYNSYVLGKEFSEEFLKSMESSMRALAISKLGFPSLKDTPPDLVILMKKAFLEDYGNSDNTFDEDLFRDYAIMIFLFSSPEMEIESFGKNIRSVLQSAREKGYYPTLPTDQKIEWGLMAIRKSRAGLNTNEFGGLNGGY